MTTDVHTHTNAREKDVIVYNGLPMSLYYVIVYVCWPTTRQDILCRQPTHQALLYECCSERHHAMNINISLLVQTHSKNVPEDCRRVLHMGQGSPLTSLSNSISRTTDSDAKTLKIHFEQSLKFYCFICDVSDRGRCGRCGWNSENPLLSSELEWSFLCLLHHRVNRQWSNSICTTNRRSWLPAGIFSVDLPVRWVSPWQQNTMYNVTDEDL